MDWTDKSETRSTSDKLYVSPALLYRAHSNWLDKPTTAASSPPAPTQLPIRARPRSYGALPRRFATWVSISPPFSLARTRSIESLPYKPYILPHTHSFFLVRSPVPWIDSISFGREMYRRFRNLLVLYLVPGPLAKVYFSSQFAPLIIFFVLFLAVVKNKKLHHFVRFNCMQAIMLDIVIMYVL